MAFGAGQHLGRGTDKGLMAEYLRLEPLYEGSGGGMVEEQRRRQAQARGGTEAVLELDGHERIEAELLQGTARLDGIGGGVAQHGGHLGADEVEQEAALVVVGEGGHALLEHGRRAGCRGSASGKATRTRPRSRGGRASACACRPAVRMRAGTSEGVGADKGDVEEGEAFLDDRAPIPKRATRVRSAWLR
jgi:hypothetical protein